VQAPSGMTSRASRGEPRHQRSVRWWFAGTLRTRNSPFGVRVVSYVPHPGNKTLQSTAAPDPWLWRISMGWEPGLCSWAGDDSGRYPKRRIPRIYRNIEGKAGVDEEKQPLYWKRWGWSAGQAVWSDLDGKGYSRLDICVRGGRSGVFFSKNQAGHCMKSRKNWLDRYTGLWRGVTTGN